MNLVMAQVLEKPRLPLANGILNAAGLQA